MLFKSVSRIAFTTDMRTSRSDGTICLLQHISPVSTAKFQFKDFLVSLKPFNETHTGVHISAKLSQFIATSPFEN